ncbi:MAG: O-antigen ligase family protein [Acidobacteria bacterium]|nr:O-antigen ligase family protein [Acidobacteriota bacterium]
MLSLVSRPRNEVWQGLLVLFLPLLVGLAFVALDPFYYPFLLILLLLGGFAVYSLVKPGPFLFLILFSCSLGGLLRNLGSVSLFSTDLSLSGLIFVMSAAIVLLNLALNPGSIRIRWIYLPLILFAAWVALCWVVSPNRGQGGKDFLFYATPVLVLVFLDRVIRKEEFAWMWRLEKFLFFLSFLPSVLFVILLAMGGSFFSRRGLEGVLGPRTISLFLLVMLSHAVAALRYSPHSRLRRVAGIAVFLSAGTIFATLSRTAGILSLILIAFLWIRPHRKRDLIKAAIAVLVIFAFLILNVSLVRERFQHQDAGRNFDLWQGLDTAGRNNFWPATLQHALQRPLTGWGPGNSRFLLGDKFPTGNGKGYHPHNEYLQVLHDLGLIGLVLVVTGYLLLLWELRRRWESFHLRQRNRAAQWNLAALLSLAVIVGSALTDNTFHYGFVLWPAFTLVATALSFSPAAGQEPDRNSP